MSSMTEYPELEADPTPERKEKTCQELADVWRDSEETFQPHNDTDVKEIADDGQDNKPESFIRRFLLAGFFTEDPVLVDEEENDVRNQARNRNSLPARPVHDFVKKGAPDIGTPKQNVASDL